MGSSGLLEWSLEDPREAAHWLGNESEGDEQPFPETPRRLSINKIDLDTAKQACGHH